MKRPGTTVNKWNGWNTRIERVITVLSASVERPARTLMSPHCCNSRTSFSTIARWCNARERTYVEITRPREHHKVGNVIPAAVSPFIMQLSRVEIPTMADNRSRQEWDQRFMKVRDFFAERVEMSRVKTKKQKRKSCKINLRLYVPRDYISIHIKRLLVV